MIARELIRKLSELKEEQLDYEVIVWCWDETMRVIDPSVDENNKEICL